MNYMMNVFLSFPLFLRISISLGIVFLLFWWLPRKKTLWVLSCIPYLLRKIFQGLYLLIEYPLSVLHKKFGTMFYKVENRFSSFGQKIDVRLAEWQYKWCYPKTFRLWPSFILYILLITLLSIPPIKNVNMPFLFLGQNRYLQSEKAVIELLEKHELYQPVEVLNVFAKQNPTENQIRLVVSVGDSRLLLRDTSSMENETILGHVVDGDIVFWSGQLVFQTRTDNTVEQWVKITTVDGISGWSRFQYLYPETFEDIEFYVEIQ